MIDIGDALAWGPALPLVRLGGRIVPLVSYDRATDDEKTLRAMIASTYACVGVGVVADAAGLLVIDVDHPSKGHGDGAATMRVLQRRLGRLPTTRTHRTKSGGWQLVFEAPSTPVRSAQRMLRGIELEAPGVDVVAGHALLRWPPMTGYEIVRHAPSAHLPESWVSAMRDRVVAEVPGPRVATGDAYARAALARSAEELAAMSSGRNVALNSVAYRLGRMCPPLDRGEVVAALVAACETNGSWKAHGSRSCLGSIQRGIRAGARKPLRLLAKESAEQSADGVCDVKAKAGGPE